MVMALDLSSLAERGVKQKYKWGLHRTREARTLKQHLFFSVHLFSFCSFSLVLLVAESHQDQGDTRSHICSGKSGDFFFFSSLLLFSLEQNSKIPSRLNLKKNPIFVGQPGP